MPNAKQAARSRSPLRKNRLENGENLIRGGHPAAVVRDRTIFGYSDDGTVDETQHAESHHGVVGARDGKARVDQERRIEAIFFGEGFVTRRALIVDRVNRDARGVVSSAVITDRVELNFSTR